MELCCELFGQLCSLNNNSLKFSVNFLQHIQIHIPLELILKSYTRVRVNMNNLFDLFCLTHLLSYSFFIWVCGLLLRSLVGRVSGTRDGVLCLEFRCDRRPVCSQAGWPNESPNHMQNKDRARGRIEQRIISSCPIREKDNFYPPIQIRNEV